MATSINVRLSDELEEDLKRTVEEVKRDTPIGAEVNNSTIVRGALIEFMQKKEDRKNGIVNFSAPFGRLEKDELESIIELSDKIIEYADKEELTDGQKSLVSLLELIRLNVKGLYISK